FRQFIEKLLFAGMKPGAAPTAPKQHSKQWLRSLRAPFERFLSGGSSSDPLYLTNRSTGRKALVWVVIGVPGAAVVAVLGLAATGWFSKPHAAVGEQPTQQAVAAALLPNFKDVQLKMSQDVVVVEAKLDRRVSPPSLAGSVRNVTNRRIESAEVMFEISDSSGSMVGGITAAVSNIAPQETANFQVNVNIRNAAFAIVREVR